MAGELRIDIQAFGRLEHEMRQLDGAATAAGVARSGEATVIGLSRGLRLFGGPVGVALLAVEAIALVATSMSRAVANSQIKPSALKTIAIPIVATKSKNKAYSSCHIACSMERRLA